MLFPTRSIRTRTTRRVLALAAAAAITLAACGDDDSTSATTAPAAATTVAAPAPTQAPATTAGGGATATTAAPAGATGAVMVADTTLGKVLVGANGMTLYLFMPDKQGDPTCLSACAKSWPPLIVADAAAATAGAGADASMIKTATNSEAGTQVTYNGWPLYFFAGDKAPGDTNGQGQGGIWYAVDPTGKAIDND